MSHSLYQAYVSKYLITSCSSNTPFKPAPRAKLLMSAEALAILEEKEKEVAKVKENGTGREEAESKREEKDGDRIKTAKTKGQT